MSGIYAPSAAEVRDVARSASLTNLHPSAKISLMSKMDDPPDDWDSRAPLTVPGVVWTIMSFDCMTGRGIAPDNIAYDEFGAEFVFRQPADSQQLAAIMDADAHEVLACYRFDGLSRWTTSTFDRWCEDAEAIREWAARLGASDVDEETADGAALYAEYLGGDAFADYAVEFRRLLRDDTAR